MQIGTQYINNSFDINKTFNFLNIGFGLNNHLSYYINISVKDFARFFLKNRSVRKSKVLPYKFITFSTPIFGVVCLLLIICSYLFIHILPEYFKSTLQVSIIKLFQGNLINSDDKLININISFLILSGNTLYVTMPTHASKMWLLFKNGILNRLTLYYHTYYITDYFSSVAIAEVLLSYLRYVLIFMDAGSHGSPLCHKKYVINTQRIIFLSYKDDERSSLSSLS